MTILRLVIQNLPLKVVEQAENVVQHLELSRYLLVEVAGVLVVNMVMLGVLVVGAEELVGQGELPLQVQLVEMGVIHNFKVLHKASL